METHGKVMYKVHNVKVEAHKDSQFGNKALVFIVKIKDEIKGAFGKYSQAYDFATKIAHKDLNLYGW